MAHGVIHACPNAWIYVTGLIRLGEPDVGEVRIDRETIGFFRYEALIDRPLCDGRHHRIAVEAGEVSVILESPCPRPWPPSSQMPGAIEGHPGRRAPRDGDAVDRSRPRRHPGTGRWRRTGSDGGPHLRNVRP